MIHGHVKFISDKFFSLVIKLFISDKLFLIKNKPRYVLIE